MSPPAALQTRLADLRLQVVNAEKAVENAINALRILVCYAAHVVCGGFRTKKHMRTVRGFYQVPPKEVQ